MAEVELGKIGSRQLFKAAEAPSRITLLLWGDAGTGKTTLAATMPGRKLHVCIDPDGYLSIANFPDVTVLDISDMSSADLNTIKDEKSPLGLLQYVDDYDTFIFDSVTKVADKALRHAIGITPKATFEFPGIAAYSVRNSYVLAFVRNLLAFTAKHNKHAVFIAHESAPAQNEDGSVGVVSIALSGDMPNRAAIDFSEVWNLSDANKTKRIMIRPGRNKKPMKTRMFKTNGDIEFDWKFDVETLEGMYISDWYEAWLEGGKQKLALPKK